jgi:hypothetical protein
VNKDLQIGSASDRFWPKAASRQVVYSEASIDPKQPLGERAIASYTTPKLSFMSERIGIVATAYAVLYTTMKGWLGGFYGSSTRTFAGGFVGGLIALNLWSILLVLNKPLATSLILHWRNESFIALIIALVIVDLAFVSSGKADKWASVAFDRYSFLNRHRNKLLIALIAITSVNFIWSIQPI